MTRPSARTLELLWHDAEPREVRLREIVTARLAAKPPPLLEDYIVASYFFAFRTQKSADVAGGGTFVGQNEVKCPASSI